MLFSCPSYNSSSFPCLFKGSTTVFGITIHMKHTLQRHFFIIIHLQPKRDRYYQFSNYKIGQLFNWILRLLTMELTTDLPEGYLLFLSASSRLIVQLCLLNSLDSIGLCSLVKKIKLVKEWKDTSNHQPKMTYTHEAVKPSKHMQLDVCFKSYWFKKSSR